MLEKIVHIFGCIAAMCLIVALIGLASIFASKIFFDFELSYNFCLIPMVAGLFMFCFTAIFELIGFL
jgi:hypothetical protein